MQDCFAVVGSNSFSGSHFIGRLLAAGHHVVGLSRSKETSGVFCSHRWESFPGVFTFRQVDMNDTGSMMKAMNDFRPNIVVNFAAQSMVAQSWDLPEDWYQTNVLGLVNFVRGLEKLSSLTKYVHVSTPEVYGSTRGWITETRDFRPSTPYAISRAAGDMHLFAMQETHGFPVCFTRAANVYGPGQQLYRIVPRALMYARSGKQLVLEGGGRSTRSFIHISDVANATYLVAQRGIPGKVYHISTSEIVSIRELVEKACLLTGVSFDELVVEGPDRPGKDDTYMLDSSYIRNELGWAPTISLDEGLRDTLNWIDSNVAELTKAPDFYVHKK